MQLRSLNIATAGTHSGARFRAKSNVSHLLLCLCASTSLLFGCGGGGGGGGGNDDGRGVDQPDANAALPSRSTNIALTSDDRYLVVVNRQNNSVSVLQVKDDQGQDTESKVGEVSVGQEPRYLALTPDDQRAYVTNAVDGTVSVIDLSGATPSLLGHPIAVGTEPRGIAISPNGQYAFVANHTAGSVSVIDLHSNAVINNVAVGGHPMAVSISNDGDTDDHDEVVYVTRFFSEVIDPDNRPDGFNDAKQGVVDHFGVQAALTPHAGVAHYTIAPLDNSGFNADRRAFCQNTRDILQEQGATVFFNSGVNGDGDGAAALASDVFCPDTNSEDAAADGAIARTLQGAYPNQLFSAVLRDRNLYLPNVGASPEPPVKFNLNVQALVTTLDTRTGHQVTTNLNNQIKTEAQPADPTTSLDRLFGNELVAIDANAQGNDFLMVSRGGNYVVRASVAPDGTLDIGAPSGVTRFQTGNIPTGVVMSRDGTRAYTNNEVSTSVTALDLTTNSVLQRDISSSAPPAPGTAKHRSIVGKLAFFTALGIPDTLDLNADGHFDVAIRDIEPLAFRGKASDNAWSSCASCHDDGHSDNVTWIFPTGPRQTIALEGTFSKLNRADQRILNWNAVRGSVTDFNNNSRGVQGGIGHATDVDGVNRTAEIFNHGPTGGISDALDAMTDWVAGAVRAPIMPTAEANAELYARPLFDANCSACHGGDKWTKSSIQHYQNNPTFNNDPLGANFFAQGREPALDANLTVGGPQIIALALNGDTLRFLDDVGTLDNTNPLELRGAGAIGGGVISVPGDPNEGVAVSPQSTQGFAALGGAGFNAPSLLGVAYHAPYFHDGSAETLDEVFNRHRLPDAGGQTIAELIDNGADLEYLKAFVLSIDGETSPFY
ncbi:MAG: beta-propeller fold lactonase family protein [Pseudomonadota bacterium]|nr:beta-propeller fold lactonase family protein [Pseudomonadota bacterium]